MTNLHDTSAIFTAVRGSSDRSSISLLSIIALLVIVAAGA